MGAKLSRKHKALRGKKNLIKKPNEPSAIISNNVTLIDTRSEDESANKTSSVIVNQNETHFTPEEYTCIRDSISEMMGMTEEVTAVTALGFYKLLGKDRSSEFVRRLFRTLSNHEDNTLCMDKLIMCLSVLCNKASKLEKLNLCFDMLDENADGFITQEETNCMLSNALLDAKAFGSEMALTSTHVHAIVQATFARATLTDSGCIDRDSFHKLNATNNHLCESLTLDVQGLVTKLKRSNSNAA